MTVSTDTTKSATVVGNGVATVFPFTFKIFQTSDVSVVLAVVATGVETVLTEGVDYSVSMNADQEADPGGEVTYPLSGSPMASTHSLTLVRDVPYTQGLDLTLGGSFNPDSIEKALDRVTTLVQQLKEAVGRAVKVSISSGLTPDEFFLDNITNAEANANAAAASAAEAATSESNAAGSEAAARASLEDFLSRYVGAAASDPVVDGNGDALTDGDLYWNTTVPEFRVYSSGAWITFLDPGVLTVTPFAETLLDDVDQAAMHVTLGTQAMIDNSRPFVGSTTLSLGANSYGFVDIANPYGTDDVDFGCEAFGSLDLSSGGMDFIVVMTAPDKRTFTVIGSTIGTPAAAALPATGYLRITMLNVNSAAQDVTVKYWIRRRT